MQRAVDFARERELVLVHDFAYADLGFDGHEPPSILQAEGADEVAVELYSLTKSFSMAGWRVGFLVGNPRSSARSTRLKSYLDYGTFQPIQIAAIVALNEAREYPLEVNEIYRGRRDALCDGLARDRLGRAPAAGDDVRLGARSPSPTASSARSSSRCSSHARHEVAVSPGDGFGPGGEGHVRFALVENEHRIRQAVRGIRAALDLAMPDREADRHRRLDALRPRLDLGCVLRDGRALADRHRPCRRPRRPRRPRRA